MLVSDLLETSELGIALCVPGGDGALSRPVSWCASTESIDPSPFLTPRALMITSGMALNVSDGRIWDAYVERLAGVPIAALAFGLGPAHRELPPGLVEACRAHGVPLLTIAADVPFVSVLRHVQDALTREEQEVARRGARLADECTRLAANGGTLHDVVQRIADFTGAGVSLEDVTGTVLVSAASAVQGRSRVGYPLPGGDGDRFHLVIREQTPSQAISPLLAPVAAVLSMQLSMTLGSASTHGSRHADRLTELVFGNASVPTEELIRASRDAGLEPFEPIGVLLLEAAGPDTGPSYLRAVAWRVRVRLAGEFPVTRHVDGPQLSAILLQGGEPDVERLRAAAGAALGDAQGLSATVAAAENAAELGLTLRMCRRALGPAGLHALPALNFDAVVDTLSHPGVVSMSRRLLAPLTGDDDRALLDTLACYLRHSGGTNDICRELFIHRNTLAYRVRKIEALLGVDLKDGGVRTMLLMAVRLR